MVEEFVEWKECQKMNKNWRLLLTAIVHCGFLTMMNLLRSKRWDPVCGKLVSLLRSFCLLRHLTMKSLALFILFAAFITNEYLVYFLQYYRWPRLPIKSLKTTKDELIVLLVADPQIQGYQEEPPFPIQTLSIWDADRYLKRTFSMAYSYSSPDVVIFLGDLMDEGSKASENEYEDYYHRFFNIFYPAENSMKIYVPGDNDIGGEGKDRRTKQKISKFETYFESLTGVVRYQFAAFFKLDIRLHEPFLPRHKKVIQEFGEELYVPFRAIINHESVSPKLKSHISPFLKPIRPNLIISGHWHKANLFVCEKCLSKLDERDEYWPVEQKDLTDLTTVVRVKPKSKDTLIEIAVPTCSYRMGVKSMGYGVLIINSQEEIRYTVLWLPSRYTALYLYAVLLLTCILVFFVYYVRALCSSSRSKSHV